MASPTEILNLRYQKADSNLDQSVIDNALIVHNIEYVCRNLQNRAGVRLLMACLLAKIHDPSVDVRKPYTEIGDGDAFSG